MKHLTLFLLFLSAFINCINAQDIITKIDNTEIKAKIIEISTTELRYKKFEYLEGPTIVLPVKDVKNIKYPNGSIENYNITNTNEDKKSGKIRALSIIYDVTYPSQKPKIKSACYNKAILLIHGSTSLIKLFTEYDDVNTYLTFDCNKTAFASLSSLPNVLIKSDNNLAKKTFENAKIPLPKINVTSETKEILGYNCKKILTVQQIGSDTTKSISYIFEGSNNLYCFNDFSFDGGITGIMLGKEVDFSEGAIQVWTANSIKEEIIDSSIFNIPSNYEVMTNEEFTQRLMKDKSIQKKMIELTPEAKKQIKKEMWNDLSMALIQSATLASQQITASIEYQKNPNLQNFNKYLNVTKNNYTKSPEEAIKANNDILSSTVNNIGESSAATNGGSGSNITTSTQEQAACAKLVKNKWESSNEYLNYMNNKNCHKMAYISQRKSAQLTLENCKQHLPQTEIDGIEKMINWLTSTINSMEDCKIYNYGK